MTSTTSREADPGSVDVSVHWEVPVEDWLISSENAGSLVRHALQQERLAGTWEVAIRFVNDAAMSQLHERFMNDPTSTDILTFPYEEEDGISGGDVVISVDTAAHNAEDAGWSTREELLFLILHGVLHIAGWDDDTHAKREAMLSRQHRLLASWKSSPAS